MLLLVSIALLTIIVPLQPALAEKHITSVSDISKSNSSISNISSRSNINSNNSSSSSSNSSDIKISNNDSAAEGSETLPIAMPLVFSFTQTIFMTDHCHSIFLIGRLENFLTTLKQIQAFPTQSSVLTAKVGIVPLSVFVCV